MELSILHCRLKIPCGTSQQCSKSHLFRGFCCQSIAWRVGHGMQDAAVKSSYQVAGTKQLTWPGHVNACWFKGCHVTWTLVAMSTGSYSWCHVVSHRFYTCSLLDYLVISYMLPSSKSAGLPLLSGEDLTGFTLWFSHKAERTWKHMLENLRLHNAAKHLAALRIGFWFEFNLKTSWSAKHGGQSASTETVPAASTPRPGRVRGVDCHTVKRALLWTRNIITSCWHWYLPERHLRRKITFLQMKYWNYWKLFGPEWTWIVFSTTPRKQT